MCQYECLQLFLVKTSESKSRTDTQPLSLSYIYIYNLSAEHSKYPVTDWSRSGWTHLGFRLMLEFSNIVAECVTRVWSVALLTRAMSTPVHHPSVRVQLILAAAGRPDDVSVQWGDISTRATERCHSSVLFMSLRVITAVSWALLIVPGFRTLRWWWRCSRLPDRTD